MASTDRSNVVETTIADIHAAYRSGDLTARQLVEIYLARIEADNEKGPAIDAVISLNPRGLEEGAPTTTPT